MPSRRSRRRRRPRAHDQASWATLDARARSFVDEAGTPIDAEIQPLVAALWGHGLTTSGSCWGHLFEPIEEPYEDPAFPRVATPWVLIEAPAGEPHPGEVTAEELAASSALRARVAGWRRANYELLVRLASLLEAFYATRSVAYDVQLHPGMPHGDWGIVLLESIGAHATRVLPRQEQATRLASYQAELRAFATFLRGTSPCS